MENLYRLSYNKEELEGLDANMGNADFGGRIEF